MESVEQKVADALRARTADHAEKVMHASNMASQLTDTLITYRPVDVDGYLSPAIGLVLQAIRSLVKETSAQGEYIYNDNGPDVPF